MLSSADECKSFQRCSESLRDNFSGPEQCKAVEKVESETKRRIFSSLAVHVVAGVCWSPTGDVHHFPSPRYSHRGYRRTKGRHTIGSYHHWPSCVSATVRDTLARALDASTETPKWVNTDNYAACASAHTGVFRLIPLAVVRLFCGI